MPQKVYKCGPDTFEDVVLATYFIYQLVPDIHWKLQQLALGSQTPLSLFVDAAPVSLTVESRLRKRGSSSMT